MGIRPYIMGVYMGLAYPLKDMQAPLNPHLIFRLSIYLYILTAPSGAGSIMVFDGYMGFFIFMLAVCKSKMGVYMGMYGGIKLAYASFMLPCMPIKTPMKL